jgi:hypothetical protein
LCRVQPFSSKDFFAPIGPGVCEILDFEKVLEVGRDIFQKSENSAFRMLISENVENEAFFGGEGVAVFRIPAMGIRL